MWRQSQRGEGLGCLYRPSCLPCLRILMSDRSRLLPALLAVLLPLALRADDPQFPKPHDTEKSTARPLPPEEAARGFRVPAGFTVDVFAAEPNVCNPIAMTWDGRGRLWVAENYTYAELP